MDTYRNGDFESSSIYSYDTNLNEILNADKFVLQNTVWNRN